MRLSGIVLVLGLAVGITGCSGGGSNSCHLVSGTSTTSNFSITPGTSTIDTNGTLQFSATLTGGGTAAVTWSVDTCSGDPNAGYGSISATGLYTPPGYLTENAATVHVIATLNSGTLTTPVAVATITVTPGFKQPLTPENATLGASGTLTFTGYTTEVGGSTGITYALSSTPTGSTGGLGTLSSTTCTRSSSSYTSCAVTYTAPSSISATVATYLVASIGSDSSTLSASILLNNSGINSNPVTHQAAQTGAIYLGTSGGNNGDIDIYTSYYGQTSILDCCGGTLGSLVQDQSGNKYILSNNHVLALTDQTRASTSLGTTTITQPGLIDDDCIPYGLSGATSYPVASLSGYVPLGVTATNVDAAIAAINTGYVNTSGSILELGLPQTGGTLAPAPPAAGSGEAPSVGLLVAKSGRTTGLTCGKISAINTTIAVSYFKDCEETTPYYTKTFTNQVSIQGADFSDVLNAYTDTGNIFSDSGDSGALIVDVSNAQPVALLFAGGTDINGNTFSVANPVSDVLSELGTQAIPGDTFTFVGGATHPVSCLNYDSPTVTAAAHSGRIIALSASQTAKLQTALSSAQALINVKGGILGVSSGQSYDRPGEAAVLVYTDKSQPTVTVPATVSGVRTIPIPTTAASVAAGSASATPQQGVTLAGITLSKAISLKQQVEKSLLAHGSYFGVGVGQSYDNPNEAALVILVDKNKVPATLPAIVNGLRTRYVIMERLHVSRSYNIAAHPSRCAVKSLTKRQPAWQPATERLMLR
jgi:hypothetical protein